MFYSLLLLSFLIFFFFFFNDTATTEIYTVSDTLSLHDALPISTFLASTNSGAAGSWTPTPLEVSRQTQPRILAIDPADEKTVYLRLLSGPSDSISVTTNGGQ